MCRIVCFVLLYHCMPLHSKICIVYRFPTVLIGARRSVMSEDLEPQVGSSHGAMPEDVGPLTDDPTNLSMGVLVALRPHVLHCALYSSTGVHHRCRCYPQDRSTSLPVSLQTGERYYRGWRHSIPVHCEKNNFTYPELVVAKVFIFPPLCEFAEVSSIRAGTLATRMLTHLSSIG